MKSGFNSEPESMLNEIRKNYYEYKIKERVAKEARKRRFLIIGVVVFSVFTGLMVILSLSRLLR
jgi:hypothetical protein